MAQRAPKRTCKPCARLAGGHRRRGGRGGGERESAPNSKRGKRTPRRCLPAAVWALGHWLSAAACWSSLRAVICLCVMGWREPRREKNKEEEQKRQEFSRAQDVAALRSPPTHTDDEEQRLRRGSEETALYSRWERAGSETADRAGEGRSRGRGAAPPPPPMDGRDDAATFGGGAKGACDGAGSRGAGSPGRRTLCFFACTGARASLSPPLSRSPAPVSPARVSDPALPRPLPPGARARAHRPPARRGTTRSCLVLRSRLGTGG